MVQPFGSTGFEQHSWDDRGKHTSSLDWIETYTDWSPHMFSLPAKISRFRPCYSQLNFLRSIRSAVSEEGWFRQHKHLWRQRMEVPEQGEQSSTYLVCFQQYRSWPDVAFDTNHAQIGASSKPWSQFFKPNLASHFVFVVLSPQMTTLNISGVNTCLKEHEIREIILQDQNSLTTFEYRNNFLKNLRKLMIMKPNRTVLLSVDLSNNKLTTLYPDVLSESIAKGLRIGGLMLSDNRLGEQFDNQTSNVFENYPELKILDLSLNGINTLAGSMFVNLTALEILNLSANFLHAMNFKFVHMNKLFAIDLLNNRLSRVNSEAQTELDVLRLKRLNLTVNMSGNPFECSCDTISSLQWILLHRNLFWNFYRYICFHKGTMVKFDRRV